MLTFGIILTVLTGFIVMNLISIRFSLLEKIGFSFPIGIGLQSILMLVLDALGIGLTATSVLTGGFVLAALLCVPLFFRRKEITRLLKEPVKIDFTGYNLIWLLFIVLIVYFEYMNFSKCMYLPTYDRDSLAGFDTIGYIASREHTFKGLSLFTGDYMPSIHNPGSYISYTPMIQLSYAYVYLLGAATSKLIPGLMFLFFLVAFYASICRVANRTGAAIATFFMLITPEMIAFSSLSATNVIHAVTASTGLIYLALWFRYRERKDLCLGSLLLALNIWTRTEGVIFIGAALCVMLADVIRSKHYKELIPLALSFTPALIWAAYMKLFGLYAEGIAITHFFWDADKFGLIYSYLKNHFSNTQYYGWSFVVLLLAFLVNIRNVIRKRDNLPLLVMIVLSALFYVIVLYQIEYKWDKIENVLAYSAKRFLFCFIPCVWYYAVTSKIIVTGLNKLEKFLSLK